jgi:hypothetical protein
MKTFKDEAMSICDIYIDTDTGFISELAKRIKAKIEDIKEFESIDIPTQSDGQFLCKYSELQECGTEILKWGVFYVIQNKFILRDKQKIIEYKQLPNLF